MKGREFITVAQRLSPGTCEADWRAIVGRAYYGLILESRDSLRRWGFLPLPRAPIHSFVRLRFDFAQDADLKKIGRYLNSLSRLRNDADYHIDKPGPFTKPSGAADAIRDAGMGVNILDQIESNNGRRLAAVAAIKAAFP